jgi:hypothetical protein
MYARPESTEAIAKIAASFGFPYGSIKVFAGLKGPAMVRTQTRLQQIGCSQRFSAHPRRPESGRHIAEGYRKGSE